MQELTGNRGTFYFDIGQALCRSGSRRLAFSPAHDSVEEAGAGGCSLPAEGLPVFTLSARRTLSCADRMQDGMPLPGIVSAGHAPQLSISCDGRFGLVRMKRAY